MRVHTRKSVWDTLEFYMACFDVRITYIKILEKMYNYYKNVLKLKIALAKPFFLLVLKVQPNKTFAMPRDSYKSRK